MVSCCFLLRQPCLQGLASMHAHPAYKGTLTEGAENECQEGNMETVTLGNHDRDTHNL